MKKVNKEELLQELNRLRQDNASLKARFENDITERKRVEEKLRMFEQTIKSINHVINIADLNDDILFVNPAFCKTYGYSEEELIGTNSSIFWSERNPKEVVEKILPATLNGGWKGELFNKRKDGTEFPIYLSTSVIKNDAGEQIAVVGVVEDITQRRRAELERQVLYEITQGVTTTVSLDEMLKLIHQSLSKVIYAENCFVALYDQNTELFSFPFYIDKYYPTPAPLAMEKSCTAYVLRTGKSLIITQELFEKLEEQNLVELVGSSSPSWVGVPLYTPSRIIGVLVLQHYEKENIYSPGDIRFLDTIGSQIAFAIERKLAEDELRESEVKLNAILQSTADGILAVDGNNKVIKNNRRFEQLWGISQSLIYSNEDSALLKFAANQLIDQEEFLSKVKRLYNSKDEDLDLLHFKDGRIFERFSAPLMMNDSSFGRIWSFRDITERMRAVDTLRESEDRFRNLVENISDVFFIANGEGKLIYCSPNFFTRTHFLPIDVIGKSYIRIVAPVDRKKIFDFYAEVTKNNVIDSKIEFRAMLKDGIYLWVEQNTRIVRDYNGNVLQYRNVVRDITERKEAEKEIRKINQELQELNKTKDKFFSIIAHDLKSPFQGLLGLSEFMAMEDSNFTKTELLTYAKEMHKSASNLYKLLENLLDWARIQRGTISFRQQELDLSFIVFQSIEVINQMALQKGITIINKVPINEIVLADEKMVETILRNLLSNAVKFTNRDGMINVMTKKINDKMIEVSVSDNGIGISEKNIQLLFKIGEKISSKGTDNEPSTGLGLLLCKEFVEKQGGQIWVESEEGKGSTFKFTLPTS